MALNNLKCNYRTPLRLKGLMYELITYNNNTEDWTPLVRLVLDFSFCTILLYNKSTKIRKDTQQSTTDQTNRVSTWSSKIYLIIFRCSHLRVTVLQLVGTHINSSSTIVVLMCENIFSELIIKVWNSLPPSIVSFKSLLRFRNSLKNVSLGIYTKY